MAELELSDGTVLEIPDDASDEAIRNFASRAEKQIAMDKGYGNAAADTASAGLSGLNRGIARTLDAPSNLLRFGLNKIGNALGKGDLVPPTGMVERGMEATNMIQPTRGHDTVAAFGENVGNGLAMALPAGALAPVLSRAGAPIAAEVFRLLGPSMTPGGSAARGVVDAAKTVGQQAAGTALQMGGSAAGEAAAGAVTDNQAVKDVAGMIAGIAAPMAPAAAWGGARQGIRRSLGGAPGEAAGKFDVLEAAGITPRPGLVGNKNMARIENTYSQFPVVGFIPQERQAQGFRQFQSGLYDAAGDIAPPMSARPPETALAPDELGGNMRLSAAGGERNLKADFEQRYGQVFEDAAPGTIATRGNLDAEVQRQNAPYGGESMGTRNSVNQFVQNEIDPLQQNRVTYAEYQPPMVERSGVPLEAARKARTEAFYDAQGGKMVGGATEQVRQAWTRDIEDALMNDPAMVRSFPDPAARQAQVERLRTLDTEYALANADNVSRAGATPVGDNWVVGGDFPALREIQKTKSDRSAFNVGSEPGRMAVLQRTAPDTYPGLAAETVRLRAQGKQPFGDINVSPQVFASWWNGLSPNERAIFANELPVPGQPVGVRTITPDMMTDPMGSSQARDKLDRLAAAGEVFRQRGAEANPSGTAPTLATIGVGTGLFTNPLKTLSMLASGAAGGAAVSSEELARILAGRERPTASRAAQAGVRAGAREVLGGL